MARQLEHPPSIVIEIAPETARRLRHEARRRDMPLDRLARELLDVVAADGLVGAVLDDDGPTAPPAS